MVLQKYLVHVNESRAPQAFNMSILEALNMLRTVWNDVTGTTMANCFRHAGFMTCSKTDAEQNDDGVEESDSQLNHDIENLFDNLKDLIPVKNSWRFLSGGL